MVKVSASSRYLERVQHTSKLTEVVGLQESQRRRARRCQASHASRMQLRVDRGSQLGRGRSSDRQREPPLRNERAAGPQNFARTLSIMSHNSAA